MKLAAATLNHTAARRNAHLRLNGRGGGEVWRASSIARQRLAERSAIPNAELLSAQSATPCSLLGSHRRFPGVCARKPASTRRQLKRPSPGARLQFSSYIRHPANSSDLTNGDCAVGQLRHADSAGSSSSDTATDAEPEDDDTV